MLHPHRAEIEAWLAAQPEMTAADVLTKLKERHPERFTDTPLRTTQRMVKAWRAVEARRMIRLGTTALTLMPSHEVVVPAPSLDVALGSIVG